MPASRKQQHALMKGLTSWSLIPIYALLEGNTAFFLMSFLPSLPVILLQCIMALMLVFMIEMIRTQNQMQDEIIQAEKMKVVSEIAASVAH